jgi:hypothetical protein
MSRNQQVDFCCSDKYNLNIKIGGVDYEKGISYRP